MAILYEAVIPLNPTTKKNSQNIIRNPKTGRYMIVQGKQYREYEKNAGWFLKRPAEPISKPVNVKYTFYRKNAIRCDLGNLVVCADDLLVKFGVIADDNYHVIIGHDGSRVFIDKDNPRTEITIESDNVLGL